MPKNSKPMPYITKDFKLVLGDIRIGLTTDDRIVSIRQKDFGDTMETVYVSLVDLEKAIEAIKHGGHRAVVLTSNGIKAIKENIS